MNNLTTNPDLNTVDGNSKLSLKVKEPLLIVLVHFKNALKDTYKGILRLRRVILPVDSSDFSLGGLQ